MASRTEDQASAHQCDCQCHSPGPARPGQHLWRDRQGRGIPTQRPARRPRVAAGAADCPGSAFWVPAAGSLCAGKQPWNSASCWKPRASVQRPQGGSGASSSTGSERAQRRLSWPKSGSRGLRNWLRPKVVDSSAICLVSGRAVGVKWDQFFHQGGRYVPVHGSSELLTIRNHAPRCRNSVCAALSGPRPHRLPSASVSGDHAEADSPCSRVGIAHHQGSTSTAHGHQGAARRAIAFRASRTAASNLSQ